MTRKWLLNGRIVLPDGFIIGHLAIEDGKIVDIMEGDHELKSFIQADDEVEDIFDCDILPSLIDLHHDAFEKAWFPRLHVNMPLGISLDVVDRQAADCGLGTIYHAITCSGQTETRTIAAIEQLLSELNNWRNSEVPLVRHRVHLRWEYTYEVAAPYLNRWIKEGLIDLISLMNHAPGQGKMIDSDRYQYYLAKISQDGNEKQSVSTQTRYETSVSIQQQPLIQMIIQTAKVHGISVMVHDVLTPEEVVNWAERGVVGCEFPLRLDTAIRAKELGMFVLVGAPNLLRGQSHEKWLSAQEAALKNTIDVMISDYFPAAMLPSLYKLEELYVPMEEAIAYYRDRPNHLVHFLPKQSNVIPIEIDAQRQLIQIGSLADFIVVQPRASTGPKVKQFWRDGRLRVRNE